MRVVRPFLLATALSLSLAVPAFAQLDDNALPAAQSGHQGALPYTTYSAETDAAANKLYCKWTSQDGRDGAGRYDFLCVGGNWATVHLMLDKSHKVGNGLARVRLLWREWPADHPASTENVVAQQFLQYTADRFIAPKLAPEVMQSFFGARNRDWQNGDVRLHYELSDQGNYRIHRLEIIGLGTALKIPHAVEPQNSFDKKLDTWPANNADLPTRQTPVLTPTDRLPLQVPQGEDERGKGSEDKRTSPLSILPSNPLNLLPSTPASPAPPQPASAADLATQPAPESLKKPVAAPTPSATLVPSTALQPNAPSNFDIYNKAQQLTRDVEEKAFGKAPPPKALPAAQSPVQQNAGGLVKPGVPAVPPLVPVPTPAVSATQPPVVGPVRVISPATATSNTNFLEGEGLGSPSTTPQESMTPAQKAAQKAGRTIDTPSTVAPWEQPVPTGVNRPLPQLKFVPKAQPLNEGPADQTIQFEDEKSRL
jgi:hypothetical protein